VCTQWGKKRRKHEIEIEKKYWVCESVGVKLVGRVRDSEESVILNSVTSIADGVFGFVSGFWLFLRLYSDTLFFFGL